MSLIFEDAEIFFLEIDHIFFKVVSLFGVESTLLIDKLIQSLAGVHNGFEFGGLFQFALKF